MAKATNAAPTGIRAVRLQAIDRGVSDRSTDWRLDESIALRPGDYNLEFMQQREDRGAPAWIRRLA